MTNKYEIKLFGLPPIFIVQVEANDWRQALKMAVRSVAIERIGDYVSAHVYHPGDTQPIVGVMLDDESWIFDHEPQNIFCQSCPSPHPAPPPPKYPYCPTSEKGITP